MFRYKLRTLLIDCAIVPPLLAAAWWITGYAETNLDGWSPMLLLGIQFWVALAILSAFAGKAVATRMKG